MPYKPKHYCAYPLCPELVESGNKYCSKHKKLKSIGKTKRSSCAEGYDRIWERLRRYKLNRNPLCEECLKKEPKVIRQAEQVHHIKKIKDYPELRLVLGNLESLCRGCHNIKTAKEKKSIL